MMSYNFSEKTELGHLTKGEGDTDAGLSQWRKFRDSVSGMKGAVNQEQKCS